MRSSEASLREAQRIAHLGNWSWDNDLYRIDLALGYRFTRHLQSKIQYSFGHRNASLQQGEQLVAAQVTLRF